VYVLVLTIESLHNYNYGYCIVCVFFL